MATNRERIRAKELEAGLADLRQQVAGVKAETQVAIGEVKAQVKDLEGKVKP